MQTWLGGVSAYLGNQGAPVGELCVLQQYGVLGGGVGAWTTTGSTLGAFLLETGTPISEADAAADFVFAGVGDYNRDGIPDLYCLKKSNTGTGRLEVHILSGASNYQSFLLETGTPAIALADAAANFVFAGVGDYNRDGIPDLYCLKNANTGTGRLEVHIIDMNPHD